MFVQSHIAEHAQLQWVLGCLTGFGEASRMTQFKDKSRAAAASSVGLFTYPILQAADILLYRPERVPVGEDQRQHLELSRDLASASTAGSATRSSCPSRTSWREVAKIYDLQHGREADEQEHRRQRRACGCSTTPKVVEKKIKSAVTDTGREVRFDPVDKPGVSNLLGDPVGLRRRERRATWRPGSRARATAT